MRSRDKFKEARYFLKEMRIHAAAYAAGDQQAFHRFRYSFNSFAISARSVTFVLQKDFRSRSEGSFDKWYEGQRIGLKGYSDILEIRNIVQKEGSRLPLSETQYEDANGNLHVIVWDHAGDDIEQFVSHQIRFGPKHEIGRSFPGGTTEEDLRTWASEAIQKHMSTTDWAQLFSGGRALSRRLLVTEEGPSVTIDEFIERCDAYTAALRQLVDAAYEKFGERKA